MFHAKNSAQKFFKNLRFLYPVIKLNRLRWLSGAEAMHYYMLNLSKPWEIRRNGF